MSGTTSKGIQYPTNTDNKDFAADMQTLAQTVNDNFLRLTGDTFTGPVTANEGLSKGYRLYNTGGSADARGWSIYLSGSELRIGKANDAYSASTDALKIDRTTSRATFDGPVGSSNYAFRMSRVNASSYTHTLAANTWGDITGYTLEYGDAGQANAAAGTFTIPATGMWIFNVQSTAGPTTGSAANNTDSIKLGLDVNGSSVADVIQMYQNFGARKIMKINGAIVPCAQGDVVNPRHLSLVANQLWSTEWNSTGEIFEGMMINGTA
jgi:hypothetical protein